MVAGFLISTTFSISTTLSVSTTLVDASVYPAQPPINSSVTTRNISTASLDSDAVLFGTEELDWISGSIIYTV